MYNYHTHTRRCGHASGNDEEYVLKAIEAKYEGIGFSDHVMLPNVISDHIRGRYEQKDEYLNSIKQLKEKYKDKIDVLVGFECEWDRNYERYYRNLLNNNEVDYLIFGNHSCYFKNGEHGLKFTTAKAYLKRYLHKTIAAFESGLFKYMAHPDLFMFSIPWNKETARVSKIICEEAKKHNIVLELNCGRLLSEDKKVICGEYRYHYPHAEFWKIAKEVGNTIIVGLDAHNPNAFTSPKKQEMADFIKELDLEVIDKIDINQLKGGK